jgi:photosystem II stability/assembly factor-like uncharacterized protein
VKLEPSRRWTRARVPARLVGQPGIFKSTNSGTTWARLATTNTPDFYYVNRLAIAPSATVILAATGTGIFRSIDAGTSWTKVAGVGSNNWASRDVVFHATNSNLAVAEYRDYDSGISSWVESALYSTNGGQTWTASAGAG